MHHSALVILLVVPLALPSLATAAVAGVSGFPGVRPFHAREGSSFRQGHPRGGSQYLLPGHYPFGPTVPHESLKNAPREVVDRIRGTLQALQALSDSQLWALLQDQPASDSDIKSSGMHMAASRQYLRRVDQQLEWHSNGFRGSTLPSSSTVIRAAPVEVKRSPGGASVPQEASDSLLMDLMKLSVYLEGHEEQPREDPIRSDYPASFQRRGSETHFLPIRSRRRSLHSQHPSNVHMGKHWLRTETCPMTADDREMVFCPTPSMNGKWKCIDDDVLCDEVSDCPNSDDESPLQCLFYRSVKTYIQDILYMVFAPTSS
ncbi:uncharacterized protein LOC143025268 [Oratosquilla oratoria]|uniref:uncharacterized protein LOC143025268 n=1 Tax=Oratosquilla oratoria TaxID=337810 RepID=UPI003F76D0B6